MTATAPRPAGPDLSPAVAPPPGNPRFALFDSLRGLAVLAVIAFHVASVTGALGAGVSGRVVEVVGSQMPILFFAISGFLLYRPFVAARAAGKRAPRASRFARRRVLRIVPAYWVALTFLAIFPGVVGAFSGDWWRYYFFFQLYSERTLAQGIPVAWTLCVEVTFYILLPLWALAARRLWARHDLVALALVAAAGAVVQIAAARHAVSYRVSESLPGQCTWFALGMALAVVSVATGGREDRSRTIRAIVRYPSVFWLVAAAAIAGLVALTPPGGLFGIVAELRAKQSYSDAIGRVVLSGALSGFAMLPAVFGERAGGLPRRVLAAAPIAWIGVVSYGMYLWHLAILEVIALPRDPQHFSASGLNLLAHLHHAKTLILFVVTIAATAVAAAASYYFVELPFLRRKER